MREALRVIVQQNSRACQHDHSERLNVLDIDMTGMPAGRQGEGVEKGCFPTEKKNHRGRQPGRVLAAHYDEVVCQRLYPGKRQLETCLPELLNEAEQVPICGCVPTSVQLDLCVNVRSFWAKTRN